ncbi:hypothetical protein [uncultured Pseudoteredinibacter sp.]|uniref:hypothetical protein n=1 Tax=uncultured Pseudoteredinibacter sp. TaxID=1641701 RepID=UPI002639CE7B|nr:hypothetical protein [uncultured Pseudoteredinibacter sp.]
MPESYLAKKACNFLIENAKEDLSIAGEIADIAGVDFDEKIVEAVLAKYKNKYGGLWVGGTVYLTEEGLRFSPNGLNELFHKGDNSLSILFTHMNSIELENGFFTKIIRISTAFGVFKFRCYGAKKFIEIIKGAKNA